MQISRSGRYTHNPVENTTNFFTDRISWFGGFVHLSCDEVEEFDDPSQHHSWIIQIRPDEFAKVVHQVAKEMSDKPEIVCEFAKYLPSLLKLAMACSEHVEAERLASQSPR